MMRGAGWIASGSRRSCTVRASAGELAERGEDADPEFVRAMLVGPLAWPVLGSGAPTPPTGAVAGLVSATLQR